MERGRQGTLHQIEKIVFPDWKAMSLKMAKSSRSQQGKKRMDQVGGRSLS